MDRFFDVRPHEHYAFWICIVWIVTRVTVTLIYINSRVARPLEICAKLIYPPVPITDPFSRYYSVSRWNRELFSKNTKRTSKRIKSSQHGRKSETRSADHRGLSELFRTMDHITLLYFTSKRKDAARANKQLAQKTLQTSVLSSKGSALRLVLCLAVL